MFEFQYPITRPYPYKWFKWAVLIGGICLTVLLTIFNLASNGYYLKVIYTVNPNETLSMKLWTDKMPVTLNEKTVPTCEAQNIQATTQHFTNKLGLTYTLASLWQQGEGEDNLMLPSFQYLGNPLKDCEVTRVQLDLEHFDGRSAQDLGCSDWGMEATVRQDMSKPSPGHR